MSSVKLVEEYTSRWKTPLPRLRILETALCYFARGSSSFTSSCDHVLHTLSSLALSVYEVLLFFDEQDFHKEPLKHFSVKFQECNIALARHQNVHLLQVEPIIRGGGAWVSRTLKEILSESSLPQNEVDRFLSSEPPVFLALRVRYLISRERVSEALALAKCCIRHPTAGKHLFFLQVYLTWLYKTQRHQLLQEVSCLNGKDAVHIICSLEYEETNELLLALCQMFLSQQLCRGEMYYLWELIFVWSKLHDRVNTSKQAFLEESRRLMLSATNINSIFPFIKVLIQELGEEGIQFCVELCANALKSCLPGDTTTKSLIYKTIAGLLPNDLEVCRACALLVFFLERTVEAYKMVYLLYMLPDQDYHVEHIPIRNQIRFETLQVLKKDLYFDPEFWNLIALQTNCLKLISEKVVDAALEELMEETWIANYCAKEFSFVYSTSTAQEEDKFTLCIDTLAEYGKKHMRAPPTAYLNEWFTAMPKRRKVAGFLASTSQQETLVTTRPQRQRCANCFTTFNSAEELQSHLQVQRCSNLFGFDSDDEEQSIRKVMFVNKAWKRASGLKGKQIAEDFVLKCLFWSHIFQLLDNGLLTPRTELPQG
nr:zinc finger protein 654-like [Nerophis lumbriciformis]